MLMCNVERKSEERPWRFMNLIHNERIKLSASWVNALAVTIVATGVIAPMAAVAFGLSTIGTVSTSVLVPLTIAWLVLGIVLHIVARLMLGRLQE